MCTTDQLSDHDTRISDLEAERFTPDYTPAASTRILRSRLRYGPGGTATAVFRGQIADVTRDVWVERGGRGFSLYAEVAVDDTTATEIKVALVPTGNRIPVTVHGDPALRLASSNGQHLYLLHIDGTVDRAAHDAEWQARREQRRAIAAAQAMLGSARSVCGDPDCVDCQ